MGDLGTVSPTWDDFPQGSGNSAEEAGRVKGQWAWSGQGHCFPGRWDCCVHDFTETVGAESAQVQDGGEGWGVGPAVRGELDTSPYSFFFQ